MWLRPSGPHTGLTGSSRHMSQRSVSLCSSFGEKEGRERRRGAGEREREERGERGEGRERERIRERRRERHHFTPINRSSYLTIPHMSTFYSSIPAPTHVTSNLRCLQVNYDLSVFQCTIVGRVVRHDN